MPNRKERRASQLPAKRPTTTITAVHQESVIHQFSGPLPAPKDFEHYEKILPGAAERILSMAEREQDAAHKQEYEDFLLRRADQEKFWKNAVRGQWAAFLLALTAMGSATYLGISGHEWIASALVGSTTLGFIGAFLRPAKTYHSDRRDLAKKESDS